MRATCPTPLPRRPRASRPSRSARPTARTRRPSRARATEQWAERLFARDTTLWSSDERVQAAIAERLGWLDAPDHFAERIAALEGFGEGIRDAGFTTAIVAGMGGSSLAPDVLSRTFGASEDWLSLRVLDSTDPAAVAAAGRRPGSARDALHHRLEVRHDDRAARLPGGRLGEDRGRAAGPPRAALRARRRDDDRDLRPGKSIDEIPHHDMLREYFLNPPDIGGRYSALTYVGLVPASLIGLDLDALLASAQAMLGACMEPDPELNPGVGLGLALGTLAKGGRDKLTFLADPDIASFGAWTEQLIAESTGKRGVGIVPVDLEPLGWIDRYGEDRVFVRLALAGGAAPKPTRSRRPPSRRAPGDPHRRSPTPIDLAAEFVRWEVATAIAGAVLGIDPFDQPNVEEAKQRTRDLLAGHGVRRPPSPPRSRPTTA